MRSRSAPRALLIVMLAASVPLFTVLADAQSAQGFVYKRSAFFGSATARDGHKCAIFAGYLESDGFFEGLQPRGELGARRFFKGSQEVTKFPPKTTVRLQASMFECSTAPPEPVSESVAQAFMNDLKFDLEWGHGAQNKPVEGFSLHAIPPGASWWPEYDPLAWTYLITIESRSVPLEDRLIVHISSKEGKSVASMTAQL